MTHMDLLIWARGPGLQIALAVFIAGMVLRFIEIYSLGRKPDLSTPRPGKAWSGFKTIISRSFPNRTMMKRTVPTVVLGYIFHISFFATLLFFAPHIRLFRSTVGFGWAALPTPLVDAIAMVGIVGLLLTLGYRMYHPVKRFLSNFDDYFSWLLTLLPLLTGYMSYHHMLLPYTLMLAVHILTVELLLVFLPFTKLVHVGTLFVSRWYNGDALGHKGARL